MITGYKSIKTIIAGLYRDLGSNTELNIADIVEWVNEGLSLIGAYSQYIEKQKCVDISNYEADLPCDFYRLTDISYNNNPIKWANNTLVSLYGCQGCLIPTCCTEDFFMISDAHIRTSFKEGKLCMVYLGIPTDDEGFPLVPDDVYFDKALKAYCTYMLDRIEFRKGKIVEVAYRDSERDWLYYCASSKGAANQPGLQQMERLKNSWVRLLPLNNEYSNNFRNLGSQERRRLY